MDRIAEDKSASRVDLVPGVCTWSWKVATDELWWSPQLCELYGVSSRPVDVSDFLELVHPDDREQVAASIRGFLDTEDTFEHAFRIVRPDGSLRWVLDRGRVLREEGRIVLLQGANIDITAQREAEFAHRSAERRAAFAARIGGLVSWEVDGETGEVLSENGLNALFGLPDEPKVLHISDFISRIHPEDAAHVHDAFRQACEPGGRYEAEFRVRRGTGWRWLYGCGEYSGDGKHARVVGFNKDIDDEHRARAKDQEVAREMQHRVKNVLSLVAALARQTFAGGPAVQSFEGRLRALASTADQLTQMNPEPVDLRELLNRVLQGPRAVVDRIVLDGPTVQVAARHTLGLTLTFHELATNALKYGALSGTTGQVSLCWSISDDGASLQLDWTESGGPPVIEPRTFGFGSRLIQRQIMAEAGNRLDIAYPPEGVRCTIRLVL